MSTTNESRASLEGLHAVVTGATDGIGARTAEALTRAGSIVYVHGRNADKIARSTDALQKIRKGNPVLAGAEPRGFQADLASLEETARLAREIAEAIPKLDVLVNNAGVGTSGGRDLSRDGYELRFAVNYLAPFVLTRNLIRLGRAPRAVINVSSIGQAEINFNDLMLEHQFSGTTAYCRSKLAQILFTIDLAEQYPAIKTNALHPGTYLDTNMVRRAGVRPLGEPTEGADAILFVLQRALEGESGLYFDQKREARAHAQAYDRVARQRLRKASEELAQRFLI